MRPMRKDRSLLPMHCTFLGRHHLIFTHGTHSQGEGEGGEGGRGKVHLHYEQYGDVPQVWVSFLRKILSLRCVFGGKIP